MDIRCSDDEVDEYWLAPFERLSGLHVENGWRWPRELEVGEEIGGTALLRRQEWTENEALRIERHYVVEAREQVHVPGYGGEAVRVRFDELQRYGEHQEHIAGSLWLALGVGLVRLEGTGSEASVSWELREQTR